MPPHAESEADPLITDADRTLPKVVPNHAQDLKLDQEVHYEFGGPIGTFFMMAFFPILMTYLVTCLLRNDGHLIIPASGVECTELLQKMWDVVHPTAYAWTTYLSFAAWQGLLAYTMPGPTIRGLPVPSLGFTQLEYKCNMLYSWYATLVASAFLHYFGVINLASIIDNVGPLMGVSIILGFVVTVITYTYGVTSGNTHRMSGNAIYDMFMGAVLNPRIGKLDLKMWAEIRLPWVILFYLSISAAIKEHQISGSVRPETAFLVLAHLLYVNACAKGEECIPTTWDIFYEKWGFMLIFWNLSGVPFTYCYATVYLSQTATGRAVQHSTPALIGLYILLLTAYYVWDTANSQKNRFKMSVAGTYIPRKSFPQLPWGTLRNPTFIKTENGSLLLTSGWWGVARKIHYSADLVMAFSWGFACGFDSLLPYFYPVFFLVVLTHRVTRDMQRCSRKYGKDWEEYCQRVPYIFIPYVF
ncbi:C-24(28) sterol reductase [Gaertneriomyces sp. JEL0708]|nr:C-24(28) sterol reductase [Gaertneriomyces sp. JEL0708]